MEIQPISYRGRTVAACTPTRLLLSDDLEARGLHDPLTRFVCAMCMYAGGVLNGVFPGPYRDGDARAHARRELIPRELLERPVAGLDVELIAAELGVPVEELFLELGRALRERRGTASLEGSRCGARAR